MTPVETLYQIAKIEGRIESIRDALQDATEELAALRDEINIHPAN